MKIWARGTFLRALILAALPQLTALYSGPVFSGNVTAVLALAFSSLSHELSSRCSSSSADVRCLRAKFLRPLQQSTRGFHAVHPSAQFLGGDGSPSVDVCKRNEFGVSATDNMQCITFMDHVPVEVFKNKVVLAGIQVRTMIGFAFLADATAHLCKRMHSLYASEGISFRLRCSLQANATWAPCSRPYGRFVGCKMRGPVCAFCYAIRMRFSVAWNRQRTCEAKP